MVPRTLLYAPIIGVGGVVMALSKSTSMSWIIAVCVLILVGFIAVIYSIVMPKFKLVQKLVDRLNLVVREHLSGMMVIRAFGTQSYEEDRFEVANRNLTRNYRFVNRVTAFMMPAMMFLIECDESRDRLDRRASDRTGHHAGRRYDGLYAVCDANYHGIFDDLYDLHPYAARGGIR